jgi:hypothetical protein
MGDACLGEGGLPGTGLTGDQDQPDPLQCADVGGSGGDPREFVGAPDQAGGRGLVTGEARRLRQDVRFQPPQVRARVQAEVRRQHLPRPAQRLQRVALAAHPVHGQRQQPPRALAPRVVRHQGLQVRHGLDGTVGVEKRGCPPFQCKQPQLVQARCLALRPRLRRELGVRRSTPQTQCLVEAGEHVPGRTRRRDRRLELPGVHRLRVQGVAGAGGDQESRGSPRWTVRLEGLAQGGHERLDRADGTLRRVLPQVGDEQADRNDPASGDQ